VAVADGLLAGGRGIDGIKRQGDFNLASFYAMGGAWEDLLELGRKENFALCGHWFQGRNSFAKQVILDFCLLY